MPNMSQNYQKNSGFDSLPLSCQLLTAVQELGYTTMTPIQAESIPLLLEGHDLIGQSKTGSGKTAAFVLPILERVALAKRQVKALILCPTRELCTQVAREARRLGRRLPGLQVVCLTGGQPIRPQICSLEKGAHVVVGTPGRIVDHLKRGSLNLSQLTSIVLDEADRMLDMGFQDDMEKILHRTPKKRQTVFFSASFPDSIVTMSQTYQQEPKRATIEVSESSAPKIRQLLCEALPEQKHEALIAILRSYQPASAIVFSNYKASVAEIVGRLKAAGVRADGLHGDLEQIQRDQIMAKLRNGSIHILVASDVAARGIDIPELDLVINYDLPPQPVTYIHRIGRTGRAGKKGVAISLASPRQRSLVKNFEEALGHKFHHQNWESLANIASHKEKPALKQNCEMETFSIAAGRKDKLRPGDILGALTGDAGGFSATAIGKIEIHDRLSYVAVSKEIAHQAIASLRAGRIKGRKIQVQWLS